MRGLSGGGARFVNLNNILNDGAGDVVFALFLEPHPPPPGEPALDRLLSLAVRSLQPRPAMLHAELFVPCAPGAQAALHFSTYVGEESGWRKDRDKNREYYMHTHAHRWRAVPVFGDQAARRVRQVCDTSEGAQYSLRRYITSLPFFRAFAPLLPNDPKSDAHCATLVARVLKRALGAPPRHTSAYYGPASLFAELSGLLARRETRYSAETGVDSLVREQRLLTDADPAVRAMGDEESLDAIRVLTLRVVASAQKDDADAQRAAQKDLATGLLRWSVNRAPPGRVDEQPSRRASWGCSATFGSTISGE